MELSTPTRKQRPRKLPAELRDRLISYFTNRYPLTKKIKVGTNKDRAYNVRVKYRENDVNRTFVVSAYSYEALIVCTHAAYVSRGF